MAVKAGGALATPTRSALRSGAPPTGGGGGARSGARGRPPARWATDAARWALSRTRPKARTLPVAMASRSSALYASVGTASTARRMRDASSARHTGGGIVWYTSASGWSGAMRACSGAATYSCAAAGSSDIANASGHSGAPRACGGAGA